MRRLIRQLAYLLRRGQHERELAEEMAFHRSMSDGAAFGNATLAMEDARDVWMLRWVDAGRRDLAYAARMLRREPLFAVAAIVTLAVGVATTTSVFSITNAELWRGLPYPHPERLVGVWSQAPASHAAYDLISGADLDDWRAQTHSFENLAGETGSVRGVLRRDSSASVLITRVSSNYFATLGARFAMGRDFNTSDASGARAVVLSDRGWQRLFSGEPSAVGRSVLLNGRTVVIVGVLAADQAIASDDDVYTVIDPAAPDYRARNKRTIMRVVGRLRAGVSVSAAQAEMQTVAARVAQVYPDGRDGHTIQIDNLCGTTTIPAGAGARCFSS